MRSRTNNHFVGKAATGMHRNDHERPYANIAEIDKVLEQRGVRTGYEDFRLGRPAPDYRANPHFVLHYEMGRLLAAEMQASGQTLGHWPTIAVPAAISFFVVSRRSLGLPPITPQVATSVVKRPLTNG